MVLLLSYVKLLLCGIAPILFTALAVWVETSATTKVHAEHYRGGERHNLPALFPTAALFRVQMGCGVAPYPVYSACCVAFPLSCLQRLLCGIAPILFTALAVWLCPYPVYSA